MLVIYGAINSLLSKIIMINDFKNFSIGKSLRRNPILGRQETSGDSEALLSMVFMFNDHLKS